MRNPSIILGLTAQDLTRQVIRGGIYLQGTGNFNGDRIDEIKEDVLVLLDACLRTGNSEDQAIRFIRSLFPTLGRADVLNLIRQLDRGGNRKKCNK